MDSKRRIRKERVEVRNPKIVGMPRNEFGTRLCQRVTCDKCHKVDYVPVRVGAKSDALCRDCAERILLAYDAGRHIQEKTVSCQCHQCNRTFALAESVYEKVEQALCTDCYRGFEVWRGKADITSQARNRQPVLTKVGTHVTLRKVTNDSI